MQIAVAVEGDVIGIVGHAAERLAPVILYIDGAELNAVVLKEIAGGYEAAVLRIATGGNVLEFDDSVGAPCPSTEV